MRPRASGPGDARAILPDMDGGLLRSNELAHEWERAHPTTLESVLDWNAQMRAIFGDPPLDREPWRGTDLRL